MKQTQKKVKRFFAAGKTSVKSTIFPFFCPHRLCCLNPALQRSTQNKARQTHGLAARHNTARTGEILPAKRLQACRKNFRRPAKQSAAYSRPIRRTLSVGRTAAPRRRRSRPEYSARHSLLPIFFPCRLRFFFAGIRRFSLVFFLLLGKAVYHFQQPIFRKFFRKRGQFSVCKFIVMNGHESPVCLKFRSLCLT